MTISRIALFASLLTLTASTAFAGTIRVGPHRTYTTIQDGVDNAADGDTILIDKGVYVETVQVMTDGLTIRPAKKGKKGKVTISAGGTGTPMVVIAANDCTVMDLHLVEGLDFGISFGIGARIRVIGCTVSGGAAIAGINVGSSYGCEVRKCKVIGAIGVGIKSSTAQVLSISKCTVKDVLGNGIEADSPAITITDNRIIRSGDNGILLGDSSETLGGLISGNTIDDSGDDGIECGSFASQCVVENNILRGNEYGIYTNSSTELLVTENRVDGTGSDGFYIDGTVTTFLKNKVMDSGDNNFYLSAASHSNLIKNKSRRAGDDGFEVGGDNHVLIKNDSRKSNRLSGTGLDFETSGATNCVYSGNIYDTSDF